MAFNRYAAGSKVYNGGSSAATRGTVDPEGYVNRSLRQRNAKQRRSGLAKAAIRRLDKKIANTDPGLQRRKLRSKRLDHRASLHKPGSKRHKEITRNDRRLESKISQAQARQNRGKPITGLKQAPKPPVVTVSPNGQLNLPWNLDNNLQAIDAYHKQQQGLLGLQEQEQQYNMGYVRDVRDAEQGYDMMRDQTRNNFAARGMGFSTAHANQAEFDATNYNNYVTDRNLDQTNFMNAIAARRLGLENNFNDVLRALAVENAMDSSKRAGDLGYGRSQEKPNQNGKKRKPKKKAPNKKRPASKRTPAERKRLKRRRTLTKQIKDTKPGLRRANLRERRLELRIKDTKPGALRKKLVRRERDLDRRTRKTAAFRRKARGRTEGNKSRR